ncbi:hypothetical protein [Ekhidna sp.]|uniref:hypothetical protein n=1 Tax=Ekhidna sp. TaxID=2608089 RepID=UPI003C7A2A23
MKTKETMKKINLLTLISLVALLLFAASCDDSIDTPPVQESILPERFSIDVPDPLANPDAANGRKAGRAAEGELNGNEIYELLSLFIAIGEGAGELTEAILGGLAFEIDREFFLSYESDDDGRVKNLTVVKGDTYEGGDYEYSLTITDAESEGNDDGGKGMQVFWNKEVIKGVAIIKPYNLDRVKDAEAGDAIYKMEYSEESTNYDAHMIVTIDNLPLEDPSVDPYSISTLKMFVGKTGEVIDVYGNSYHPNATFFTDDLGFNWAFVASGIHKGSIGVAEVGLPGGSVDSDDREVLLVENSLKNVFTAQIQMAFPGLPQEQIDAYLQNTEAPGYFNSDGFIQGGESPDPLFDQFADRLQDLTPYNPAVIAALEVNFE